MVGAPAASERSAFEALLAGCDECLAELQSFVAVAGAL
jgi:anti-sigma factor RsiW